MTGFEASAGLESRWDVAFRFRDVGGGCNVSGIEVAAAAEAAADAVSTASLAEERVTLEDMRNLILIQWWCNPAMRIRGHMCGFLRWISNASLRLPLPVVLRKGTRRKTANCKTGCTYLGVEVGVEMEESCEDSIVEEGAGAIRLNLHGRR